VFLLAKLFFKNINEIAHKTAGSSTSLIALAALGNIGNSALLLLHPFCLGCLGQHNTNGNHLICALSLKVAKERRLGKVFLKKMPMKLPSKLSATVHAFLLRLPWVAQHKYDGHYLCHVAQGGQGKRVVVIAGQNCRCFHQCLLRDRLVIPDCKQNMVSVRGQAS
jgi:hypothetical protein